MKRMLALAAGSAFLSASALAAPVIRVVPPSSIRSLAPGAVGAAAAHAPMSASVSLAAPAAAPALAAQSAARALPEAVAAAPNESNESAALDAAQLFDNAGGKKSASTAVSRLSRKFEDKMTEAADWARGERSGVIGEPRVFRFNLKKTDIADPEPALTRFVRKRLPRALHEAPFLNIERGAKAVDSVTLADLFYRRAKTESANIMGETSTIGVDVIVRHAYDALPLQWIIPKNEHSRVFLYWTAEPRYVDIGDKQKRISDGDYPRYAERAADNVGRGPKSSYLKYRQRHVFIFHADRRGRVTGFQLDTDKRYSEHFAVRDLLKYHSRLRHTKPRWYDYSYYRE